MIAPDQAELRPLTGLRFVAALYVFVFHMHIRWPIVDTWWLQSVLEQGAVGMSLFFVLSGFILAYRYYNGGFSWREYAVNRFSRIYPVYAIAALTTLPWLGISISENPDTVLRTLLQCIILVFTSIFVIQAWFPSLFDYWNNGASWSISVEFFCYAVFPFFLPVFRRLNSRYLLIVGALLYVLSIAPGLIETVFPGNARVFYSVPLFRLPEFLFGVCSFLAFRNGWFSKLSNSPYQIAAIVVFAVYLSVFGHTFAAYVGHNWVVVPLFSFLIVTLAFGNGLLATFLSTGVCAWLGQISYCFYSFQALVILGVVSQYSLIVDVVPLLSDNRVLFSVTFFVLLAVSACAFRFVEEPARNGLKRMASAQP